MRVLREASALPHEARALVKEYKRHVQRLLPGATVLLYGSRARGAADPESDWDILVLTDKLLSTAEQDRVRDALYDLELEHGMVASLLFCAKAQWNDPLHRAMAFHKQIEREGIVL